MTDAPTPVEDVTNLSRAIRERLEKLREAVALSMDQGDPWERETSEVEPDPTPESVPPMEEPTEEWERKRTEEIRAQMRANWPSSPRALVRRKLPIR